MAETTALDFRFGTKQREDKTVQMNIYELGGGRVLAGLLQSVFVGNGIDNAAIIICLDLSKPGNSIESLLFWLQSVREQTNQVLNELKEKNPSKLKEIVSRLQNKWAEHEDKARINISYVPIVIIGTKYDVFANTFEIKPKKMLCDALRYLAHSNGCDLVFASVRE